MGFIQMGFQVNIPLSIWKDESEVSECSTSKISGIIQMSECVIWTSEGSLMYVGNGGGRQELTARGGRGDRVDLLPCVCSSAYGPVHRRLLGYLGDQSRRRA